MFVFTVLALVAVASAQFPFPGLGGSLPSGGNNNNNGNNNGGLFGNGGFQLDSNILTQLGNLFQGQNGGSGNGASVGANGTLSFSNIGEFFTNAGLKISPDLSLANIQASLSSLNLGSLGLKGESLQDVRNIISRFTGLTSIDGKITAAGNTTLNGDLVTASPVEIDSLFNVLKGKVLQTVNALVLKANASLTTDTDASVSSAITQFLGGNADFTKGNFSTGVLLVDAKTKILGSFQVLGDHLAQLAANANLELGNTVADPNTPSTIAQIIAKINATAGSALTFNGPTSLIGNIGGDGNITIKSLLDLTGASRLGGAIDSETLIKAKTLILDKLADLKLQVQANSGILSNITQGLDFGGAKIDITIPENIKQTVLKFLHGSATGKAQISIDGKSVIDVTSGAPAGTPPAGAADANGNVWTVNYGDKETTLELKNEKEVYAATTVVLAIDSTAHSGVASTTIAVAAVVAAIAVMN